MLDMITNLLPLLGGGIFGALMTLWSNAQKDKADAHLRMLEVFDRREGSIKNSNETAEKSNGFAFTRRIIALSLISVLVGTFWMQGTVTVPITVQEGGSYFFGLWDTRADVLTYETLKAPLVLPEVLQSCQAIIGVYFGNSMTKR